MKKKCPDGKYYCYTDKKCKDIPRGFKVVGPAGMLRKENGHSVDDDSETKNGKKNGNGHSNGNGNGGAVSEDLRKWFGSGPKGGKGGGGWDRYNTKGERIGKCARGEGEGKPKCLSNEKAAKMSKAERAAAVRRKRREDPVADRPGKGGKPIMTSNKIKESSSPMVRQILEKIECEREWLLVEKNVPTNPSLWSKFKAQAKAKFDVYPSAYANGWAAKKYKAAGGGWKSVSEEVEMTEESKKSGMECKSTPKGKKNKVEVDRDDVQGDGDMSESVRIPAQTGNVYSVIFSWRAKVYMIKLFFPEIRKPKRDEVQDAIQKIYPGSIIKSYNLSSFQPGEQFLNAGVREEVQKEGYGAPGHNPGAGEKSIERTKAFMKKKGMKGAPGLNAMAARKAEHEARRGVKKEEVENVDEAAAWTKKSGKNSEGGLNEKGRKSYERENPGSDLKRPSKKVGNPRRKSFCARMKGMKKKLTSSKTANDPDSRINKSLRAWNC